MGRGRDKRGRMYRIQKIFSTAYAHRDENRIITEEKFLFFKLGEIF